MEKDFDYLRSLCDEFILSSLSTNLFLSESDSLDRYNEICEALITKQIEGLPKKGDKIIVTNSEDEEFTEWYEERKDSVLTVSSIEYDSRLLWVEEGFDGAISFDSVVRYEEKK
jgi:hypothetical protein